MNLERDQWNYVAVVGALVLVFLNTVTTAGLFMDLITWEQFWAAAGWINGPAIGWVGKALGQKE